MAAEAVGLAASIVQLLAVLKAAYCKVTYGFRVTQQLERVMQRFEPLRITLLEEPHRARFSNEVLAALDPVLHGIKQTLESIPHPSPPASASRRAALQSYASISWYGFRHGSTVEKMLDDVLMKLSSLSDQAMLTCMFLSESSSINSCIPEDCHIPVGLDRAAEVLQFIRTPPQPLLPPSSRPSTSATTASTSQLRIVGIVGQGGLGKRTLLAHILNKVRDSFGKVAYVRFEGESLESRALENAQSHILLQLGGSRRKFQVVHEGRKELMERLRMLEESGKSVCIGIENVWRAEDLEALLPGRLATLLPSLNICMIITSRVKSIVGRLSYHCGEDPRDPRVLSFEPQLLQESISRELLVAHTNLRTLIPGESHLIDRISPFCCGLPLALRLTGALFGQVCEVECWEDWMRDMAREKAGVPLQGIDHILELSYKHLQYQSQEALMDIGACLFDWPWEVVENIVGSMPMNHLQDLSLIAPAITRGSCNSERSVRMHDLIRKLAAKKQDNSDMVIWDPERWSTSLLSSERIHASVKFLCLDVKKADQSEMSEGEMCLHMDGSCFPHMKKLKVLEICGSFKCTELLLPISLCFLKFEGNKYLTEVNLPSRLQHLELKGCVALTELPASIYECSDLRYLCIIGSPNLQGFQTRSKWRNLSRLWLEKCANITNLPGDLAKLKRLTLIDCGGVQEIPKFYHKLDSQQVYIQGCPCEWPPSQTNMPLQLPSRMNTMGNSTVLSISPTSATAKLKKQCFRCMQDLQSLPLLELGTLENVTICNCRDDKALWSILLNMASLKKLTLKDCEWLELGQFSEEVQNLTILRLEYNQLLRGLPGCLRNLSHVRMLGLNGCTNLQELPEEIGSLTRLEKLELQGCESLVRLPDSICELRSLEELDMTRCSKLEGLPGEMTNMTSLTKLSLGKCTSLKLLPNTLCDLTLLKVLNMAECSELEELPKNMGNLQNLKMLLLSSCPKLRRLPESLCRLADLLTVLDLTECDKHLDIPSELRRKRCLKL